MSTLLSLSKSGSFQQEQWKEEMTPGVLQCNWVLGILSQRDKKFLTVLFHF